MSRKRAEPLRGKVHISQLPKNFIFGINEVREALRAGALRKAFISADSCKTNPRLNQLREEIRDARIEVRELSTQAWFKALENAVHQGAAGITKPFTGETILEALDNLPESAAAVLVDGINDPHNLGALIRNAAAVRALVILPKHGVPKINATVHKTSAGCTYLTPIVLGENLSQAMDILKQHGFWVAAMDAHEGESIFSFEFPKRLAVVVGSEERGVSKKLREKSDFHLRIPMAEGVDSLNLSAAVAVTLFFFRASQERKIQQLI